MTAPQNKIEIFGPKNERSYWLELRQSDGQSLFDRPTPTTRAR
jgi:hypothetical protein